MRLCFWGAQSASALAGFANLEWTRLRVVDAAKYAKHLGRIKIDICLAPLRDNLFNRCKRPIKHLEHAALGAPVISSRLEPYEWIVRDSAQ